MAFRDRIKEFRRIHATKLKPNPRNWRSHPQAQREAMQAMLAEIGFADVCLVRKVADDSYEIIDGHLRDELAPDQDLPCVVLDVTEAESDKLLALLDPLAGMAEANETAQRKLLAEIEADEAALRRMVEELTAGLGPEGDGEVGRGESAGGPGGTVDGMELVPHEHYDYVIVLARNTHEWNQLCELLNLGLMSRGRGSFKRMGIGRGVEASKLIDLLTGVMREHGNLSNRGPKPAPRAKRKKGARASA